MGYQGIMRFQAAWRRFLWVFDVRYYWVHRFDLLYTTSGVESVRTYVLMS